MCTEWDGGNWINCHRISAILIGWKITWLNDYIYLTTFRIFAISGLFLIILKKAVDLWFFFSVNQWTKANAQKQHQFPKLLYVVLYISFHICLLLVIKNDDNKNKRLHVDFSSICFPVESSEFQLPESLKTVQFLIGVN